MIGLAIWIGGGAPVGAQDALPSFGGGFGAGFGSGSVDPKMSVSAQFTAATADQPGRLTITAHLKPDWHIYSITQGRGGPLATKIKLNPSSDYRVVGDFRADPVPQKKMDEAFPGVPLEVHEKKVSWEAPIELAAGVDPARLTIGGAVNAQLCDPNSCTPPQDFRFTASLVSTAAPRLTNGETKRESPTSMPPPAGREISRTPPPAPPRTGQPEVAAPSVSAQSAAESPRAPVQFSASQVRPVEMVEAKSLLQALLFAFGGGLILNIMPCVLPVIGLKILAFFEQAGHSRARAFTLNVWYSLGLISVFLVLASLNVGLSKMFTGQLFGIIMAVIVFLMALSLMGLWELQVPGFLGGKAAHGLSRQEGAVGAYFKGIITTLLAIPCGAPLLSPALKFSDDQVRAGSPGNVYLVYGVVGLGMAVPYLIIGGFPELLRVLPKPGDWLETFRKTMGYLLLVAVVWILYFLPLEDIVPTVAFLFALWFACWLVGRLPWTAGPKDRVVAWVVSAVVLLATGATSVLVLRPAMQERIARAAERTIQAGDQDQAVHQRLVTLKAKEPTVSTSSAGDVMRSVTARLQGEAHAATAVPKAPPVPVGDQAQLPWQPFSRAQFDRLVAAEKTVLIDFTADWCLTCKTLERLVLNTAETRAAVDRAGIVTLRADWTDGAAEVTEMLKILGSEQVPVIAIFPAGDPNHPIVLRGGYTRQSLLDALAKAAK